jgi:hypothetical protein
MLIATRKPLWVLFLAQVPMLVSDEKKKKKSFDLF